MNMTIECPATGASQSEIQSKASCESIPKRFRLTKSESIVLELLWDYGDMTQDEINQKAQELEFIVRTWKPRSVFTLLNGLIRRDLVKVASMKRAGKTYARVFTPTMSRPEYYAALVQASMSLVEVADFISIMENTLDYGDKNAIVKK